MAAGSITPISDCERPACAGGSSVPIRESAPTKRPPAPMPWSARKAINCPMSWASPQSTDPMRKTTMEAR